MYADIEDVADDSFSLSLSLFSIDSTHSSFYIDMFILTKHVSLHTETIYCVWNGKNKERRRRENASIFTPASIEINPTFVSSEDLLPMQRIP